MKKLFALSLALLSLSASALSPLYVDLSTGENVYYCEGKIDQENLKQDMLFFRYKDGLTGDLLGNARMEKLLVAYVGHETFTDDHSTYQKGVSLSQFRNEAQYVLPENGEAWTHESPEGTVIAAKGNYKGFFLYKAQTGQYKALFVSKYPEQTFELSCFTDLKDFNQKLETVSKYSPYK